MILIGCGKSKRREACAAGDLYTGGLFAARKQYAERCTEHWHILSAKFGVLAPSQVVSPYDCTMRQQAAIDQVVCRRRLAALRSSTGQRPPARLQDRDPRR